MTLESIAAKLDRNYAQGQQILKALKGSDRAEWVKLATVIKETRLTHDQVRYERERNPAIARDKGNGRFEYNLTALKQVAA